MKGKTGYTQYSTEELNRMVEYQLNHLHEKVRVFSLAEKPNNVLMWSHYSLKHTGFCIGFDVAQLKIDTKQPIGRCNYDDFPLLNPTKHDKYYVAQALSKAKDWQYENEWRMTNWAGENKFKITSKSISKIIFGCKATKSNIDRILDVVSQDITLKHIQLLQAKMVPFSCSIEIVPFQ
jgi:hypothetical protein